MCGRTGPAGSDIYEDIENIQTTLETLLDDIHDRYGTNPVIVCRTETTPRHLKFEVHDNAHPRDTKINSSHMSDMTRERFGRTAHISSAVCDSGAGGYTHTFTIPRVRATAWGAWLRWFALCVVTVAVAVIAYAIAADTDTAEMIRAHIPLTILEIVRPVTIVDTGGT
jgi:hypothetical protein